MAIKSASVKGLDELIDAFMKLPDDTLQYVKTGSMEAANIVCEKAKQLAPVDSGQTKNLLYVRKPTASKKAKYKVLSTITAKKGAAPLAPLELGHKLFYMGRATSTQIAPRPFLRPAADQNKDTVADIIAESMNKAIAQMGGMK